MKQFIVLLAVLPLLLVFFVQFSMDQMNNARIGLFLDFVYTAKEEAKQQGCFTKEITDQLKENLSEAFDILPSAVIIQTTESVRYRMMQGDGTSETDFERGLIYYKISVPISEIMAGRRLFGIHKDDNMCYYTIESYTASELLP
ncbi:MAG: hypothetical protein EOM59_00425 [Clostridia bacterium]|nr:hypothetical protein [Clostridia bacterium]